MRIYAVTNVVVYRTSTSPPVLTIHATGLTTTSGWGNPRLDNSADKNPADDVHEFAFEADKPSGLTLEVLTPVSASVTFKPKGGAGAVIVSSRTNSITVHASEFIAQGTRPANAVLGHMTTDAIGEETLPPRWPTLRMPGGEHVPTTHAFGEELPRPFPTSPLADDPAPIPPWDWRSDPWGPMRSIFGGY